MHEKFRHLIEDFQMEVCPAPANLELLDFGCTQSSSPGSSAPGHVCALLSPCLFLARSTHPAPTGKRLCSVPGEGTGWGGRQFLPVHLQIAVVMGRKFLRGIQCTACSLSHCSSFALSITQHCSPGVAAAALPCPRASLRLLEPA